MVKYKDEIDYEFTCSDGSLSKFNIDDKLVMVGRVSKIQADRAGSTLTVDQIVLNKSS